ncbi:MAG: OmpH family outer membrane protein [Ferruginibacter sp.]
MILNLILVAAVGYLYYHSFSGSSKGKEAVKTTDPAAVSGPGGTTASIAYVELDSLNENITYIRQKRKELEAEQKNIESEWENGYKGLQAEKDNFLKKGAAISQEEAEKFQAHLMEQQQVVDNKKQTQTAKLNEKSFSIMDDIQKNLREFLNEYNKSKKYTFILTTGSGQDYMAYKDSSLNITNDVIRGMNEKMKALAK